MWSLSDKQKEFWNNCNSRWNIKCGATRSGKTYLDYFHIAKRVLECRGEGLIVFIGNTQGTFNRNVLEPMRGIWTDQLIGNINSDGRLYIFGKKAYVLGADKITNVQRLQGAGIEYCYGDEVTTWNEDVFNMLKSRLDKPHSRFDGTCNPDSPGHWFKKFLESDADIFCQKYTIYDNKYLTEEFVRNIENEYRGTVYFERFIKGNWAMAEGIVYPMFSEQKHIIHDYKEPENGEYYVSCDYGTLNPFSMGLWHIDRKQQRAVRIKEYYYDGRKSNKQKTDEEYYIELVKLCGDRIIQGIVVDPSAASFIATIRSHGQFTVRKANNDVLNGIRNVASYLNMGKLAVSDSCKDAIREFGMYCWDKKAAEDKVVKENDHAMDDIRYFVNTILKREL